MEGTTIKLTHRSNRRKITEPMLFSIILVCMVGAITMPIMMHGDIGFGDSPSYTSMFRFDFANAKEVHRYRLFVPLMARGFEEMIQYFGLGKAINHLGEMQDFKDALTRVCFWMSSLISTLVGAWALYILMKPLKPRMLEAVGAVMVYFTSRGYLFNIGSPVVDGWEITGLIIAAAFLQKRQYTAALAIGIAASVVKETSIPFVCVPTVAMILMDKDCDKLRRIYILAAAGLILAVGPQITEVVVKRFEEYLLGGAQLSGEETYATALELLGDFIHNLIGSPLTTMKAFITGLIKMNSPVLLIGGLAGISTCMRSGETQHMESIGRYYSLLVFTATGVVAGAFSGVFGMRFLETAFVLIPFLIYGFRKVSRNDEDCECNTDYLSVRN